LRLTTPGNTRSQARQRANIGTSSSSGKLPTASTPSYKRTPSAVEFPHRRARTPGGSHGSPKVSVERGVVEQRYEAV
jgi:hypothetical protein